jgi:hypothetical protein
MCTVAGPACSDYSAVWCDITHGMLSQASDRWLTGGVCQTTGVRQRAGEP